MSDSLLVKKIAVQSRKRVKIVLLNNQIMRIRAETRAFVARQNKLIKIKCDEIQNGDEFIAYEPIEK